MKFSPYGSSIPPIYAGKFHAEILTGSLRAGASNNGLGGKIESFSSFKRQYLENAMRYARNYC